MRSLAALITLLSGSTVLAQSLPASAPSSMPASAPAVINYQNAAPREGLVFSDPRGDDDGPGSYKYPSASVYKPGSFDITGLLIRRVGDDVIFQISFASKVEDPWGSTGWGGYGFSLQLLQIYLDLDRVAGSGEEQALPGMNVRFANESRWDRAILISSQPAEKAKSEVQTRASSVAARVIVPRDVQVQGPLIIVKVSAQELGASTTPENWGVQVLSGSTEGFPEGGDLYARRVTTTPGEHRFGGGADDGSAPNFVDMLFPGARGDAQEISLQHEWLSGWASGAPLIPMVYTKTPDALPQRSAVAPNTSTSSPNAKILSLPFTLKSEIYTKWLYQNDQSQGTVSLGNPNVEGDNFSGNNGVGSELALSLSGKVSPQVEAGAHLASRFGQQWTDFYENGDLAVDENGVPSGVDSTGESLGQNHAAYLQLRGFYVRMAPPIKHVDSILVGSSDLGMFNPWTIGKIRFIDRFNSKGVFVQGKLTEKLEWLAARIALPKLFASAGFNTGIDDPLIENPFFTRDAAYAVKLRRQGEKSSLEWIASLVLDEEADVNDPDALGSTNVIDTKDGVVATLPRYINANTTLEYQAQPSDTLSLNLLAAGSFSSPWLCAEKADQFEPGQECHDLVFNSVEGSQGFSPIVMKTVPGYALKARFEAVNPLKIGVDFKAEYFNISENWTATFGARREQDVLLTEGFLDGQLPTLNIANEFQDFYEPYYESIIGWHGGTLQSLFSLGKRSKATLEYSLIGYNTNEQNRDTDSVFPDFLFTQGYTDTELFTFANTNDRGRDPRAVYQKFQSRLTNLWSFRFDHRFSSERSTKAYLKGKYILDSDKRCLNQPLEDGTQPCPVPEDDDYFGMISMAELGLTRNVNDQLTATFALKGDYWKEYRRSGELSATGEARFDDYTTKKAKFFTELSYVFGGAEFKYRLEVLNKDVEVTPSDERSFSFRNIIRSVGSLVVKF